MEIEEEEKVRVMRKEDIMEVVKMMVEMRDGRGEIEEIENIGKRRVSQVGEMMEKKYRVGMIRMEREIKESM